MFRTLKRKLFPNPLDTMLKKTARKGGKKILLGWNRGLGDIALGLYAIVQRIREWIPDAEITFVTRENLRDGFSLLEGVKTIVLPNLKRGEETDFTPFSGYDLVIKKPNPTEWVAWQRGKVVPRLKYKPVSLPFSLPKKCIGVQLVAETNYGLWRNWPLARWEELFEMLPQETFLLFGFGNEPKIERKNVIDLRGKTDLFQLLSVIKNHCDALILPDSGILSMAYYLEENFPLKIISLWGDPNHGILKQAVASPNSQLIHIPLVAPKRDLSQISAKEVAAKLPRVLPVLLAGGQGSRLGFPGPKGLFPVLGKPLFQWISERLPKESPLAIMVSPLNAKETKDYFEKNQFFGLKIYFFEQEMAPFLDEERRPLEQMGPNGNGSVFRSFVRAGLDRLEGFDFVSIFYVDNLLANPFDPTLISYAKAEKADATLLCIERKEESMGAVVEENGKIRVIEYTELEPGKLYPYAYSGQMVFSFSFFCQMAEAELPIHWVRKQGIWKGEKFIFDVLPLASRVRAIAAPREKCYAPLKSLEHLPILEKALS